MNPVLAPAGIYLLIRAKRARSKRRYYSADRFLYQAGGITIIGIIFTITTIVLLILTLHPMNQENTDKTQQGYTTTSNNRKDSADIHSAGERLFKNFNLYTSSGKRTTHRSARRTSSPRQIRHSSHRFGSINADNTRESLGHTIYPTKTARTTKLESFNDLMKGGVAETPIQLMFSNRTHSIFFQPKSNKTIVVHIPEFLQ